MPQLATSFKLVKTRAVFIGSKALGLAVFNAVFAAAPSTEWIVVHPDDSQDPRSQIGAWERTSSELGVRFKIANKSEDLLEVVDSHRPDAGIVCGWYRILNGQLLKRFPLGLWGIHNSLLPKYRGGAPLVWSIINGDELVGSTLFQIDEGMDSGPILLQVSVKNLSDRNVGQILDEIQHKMLLELPDAWRTIIDGSAVTRLQAHERATYCAQRNREDGRIDWTDSATSIHNFIRAQTSPYLGAFTVVNGMRVEIDASRVFPYPYHGVPGQVIRRSTETVIIACGANSALEVLACSINGASKDPGSAFPSTALRLSRLRD
jgi:methionyl-tRNA formyltransferase